MKFTYAYKTSDGKRHEDAMEASSREEVFVALRAKGIRAIKVVAADGSKANGAPVGGRGATALPSVESRVPRDRAVTVIGLVSIGLIGLVLYSPRLRTSLFSAFTNAPSSVNRELLTGTTRRQLIGDAFIIEKGIRTGWSDVFTHEGERFLASFAIPGVPAAQRTSTEAELRAALKRKILPSASDSLEAQQIKAMVEGMKDELRRFMAAGGTIAAYGRRLVQRQDEELRYYNMVKNELDAAAEAQMSGAELEKLWIRRNEELRQMGIRLVPMPE